MGIVEEIKKQMTSIDQGVYMKKSFVVTWLIFICIGSLSAQSNGSISGTIRDRDTSQPLMGVNVMLDDTPYGAATDFDGKYLIDKLPVGSYRVRVDMMGYEAQARANIHVASNRMTEVNIDMIPTVLEGQDIQVTAGFFERAKDAVVSVRTVDIEEIRSDPVGAYDVMRMMQALPAVVSGSDQNNEIIIRGGSPGENLFVMDHLEIPYPNHFAQAGTGGGPVTMINTEFIERIDFYAGSFPARFGGKVSSVMDVTLREGNRTRSLGQFNFNMAGFGLTYEGPLGENANYIATLKRSFLDFVISNTGLAAVPEYWSGQAKVTYHLSPGRKLMINFLGGIDAINIIGEETPQARGAENVNYSTKEYTIGMTYKSLIANHGYWVTSLGQSLIHVNTDVFRIDDNNLHDTYYTQSDTDIDNLLKSDIVYKFSSAFELSGGLKIQMSNLNYDDQFRENTSIDYIYRFDNKYYVDPTVNSTWNGETVDSIPGNSFYYEFLDTIPEINLIKDTVAVGLGHDWQSKKTIVSPSVWIQGRYFPIPKLEMIFGMRVGQTGYTKYQYISPRLSLVYTLMPGVKLNVSGGRYYQPPINPILNGDFADVKNLKDYYADQVVAGLEYLPREDVRVTLELFEKKFEQLVTAEMIDTTISGQRVIYFDNGHQVNAGAGRSYGLEFYIQKKLLDNWYGSFSYSKSVAQGIDPRDGKTYYPWSYDYGDVMTLIGGYKIKYMNYDWYPTYKSSLAAKAFSWLPFMPSDEYEISFRARYVGGRPYTEPVYNPYKRRWYAQSDDPLNSKRYDPYYRFDIMLLQRFYFEKMNMVVFWDIMNLTNRDNPWEFMYKSDGSKEMSWQFKTFPVGGVLLEF